MHVWIQIFDLVAVLIPKLSPCANEKSVQATECWKGPGNEASLGHSVSLCINPMYKCRLIPIYRHCSIVTVSTYSVMEGSKLQLDT